MTTRVTACATHATGSVASRIRPSADGGKVFLLYENSTTKEVDGATAILGTVGGGGVAL